MHLGYYTMVFPSADKTRLTHCKQTNKKQKTNILVANVTCIKRAFRQFFLRCSPSMYVELRFLGLISVD
jgi:hypothetical protein